jgi:hypothetical protein
VPRLLTVLAAIALVALFALWRPPAPPIVPFASAAPMPAWAILPPGERRVVASGVYPPQPPYGSAATITYAIDGTAEQFTAAYEAQLAAAGYDVRRVSPIDLPFNAPDAQFEADERSGGHVIYLTLRHTRTTPFAQLTFWAPPAPRLP